MKRLLIWVLCAWPSIALATTCTMYDNTNDGLITGVGGGNYSTALSVASNFDIGVANALAVGQTNGNGYQVWRSYIEFTNSCAEGGFVPLGATISSVTLTMTQSQNKANKSFNVQVLQADPFWTSGDITSSNMQSYYTGCQNATIDGGPGSGILCNSGSCAAPSLSLSTTYPAFGSASKIHYCLKSGNEGTVPTSDEYLTFYYAESGTGTQPKLVVVYDANTPTPSRTFTPAVTATPTKTPTPAVTPTAVLTMAPNSCKCPAGAPGCG